MTQKPHPDTISDYHALKAITRGGTQAADSAAMEAYWLALESGRTAEEAETIFSDTYYKIVSNGK